MADLVLWKPEFFGAKPEMVIKGGQIVCSSRNTITFGAYGKSPCANSVLFISKVFFFFFIKPPIDIDYLKEKFISYV